MRWLLRPDLNTSALLCDFSEETRDDFGRSVSNQEDVNRKYEGCTEIHGAISIALNYTGPLYLANVTYISDGIYTTCCDTYTNCCGSDTPLLTSIELPDLNSTGEISIKQAPSVATVSFPSLSTLNTFLVLSGLGLSSVNFPSLTALPSGLYITGNIKSVHFPLLTEIGGDYHSRIARSGEVVIEHWDENYHSGHSTNLDFPAMLNISSILFEGNITSLSMPRLRTIEKLDIYTYGNPLNVSLPSLSNSSHISLAGTIGATSFPLLRSVGSFEVNSADPIEVTLDPLETITGRLNIKGNITGVDMSSVMNVHSLFISSDCSVDCSSAMDAYYRSNHTDRSGYHCAGLKRPKNIKLQLGLGIGLGVPAFFAFYFSLYLWKQRASRKIMLERSTNKDTPPPYSMDNLPPYVPAAGTVSERGSEASITGTQPADGDSSVQEEGVRNRPVANA
ncbi:hypothetical protein V500_02774 [Pseudogymnoascus sp. VKM F-4518 (FW-2643)]|nr:hypothetical protein V500_02774 [Pseudogymnoascus sp. VKM F-4518 (FW-2643)]